MTACNFTSNIKSMACNQIHRFACLVHVECVVNACDICASCNPLDLYCNYEESNSYGVFLCEDLKRGIIVICNCTHKCRTWSCKFSVPATVSKWQQWKPDLREASAMWQQSWSVGGVGQKTMQYCQIRIGNWTLWLQVTLSKPFLILKMHWYCMGNLDIDHQ